MSEESSATDDSEDDKNSSSRNEPPKGPKKPMPVTGAGGRFDPEGKWVHHHRLSPTEVRCTRCKDNDKACTTTYMEKFCDNCLLVGETCDYFQVLEAGKSSLG